MKNLDVREETVAVVSTETKSTSFSSLTVQNHLAIVLAAILVIGLALRMYRLGQSSLWYDEVVTMRLARTENPLALLHLVHQLDATRAPLHPLMLQAWLKMWGPSDYSGRIFSVLCGTSAIAVVYWIGLQAFDARTGLWAAWLCTVSPLLVYYSREVRMYMWLTLLTCLAWALLFSHVQILQPWRLTLYALCLIALVYSHPLGLLMVGALGLASGIFQQPFQIVWRHWLYAHLAVILATFPWLRHYLDHAPELTTGVLPLRYLLGVPIGFIGGNSGTLLFCLILLVYGQCRFQWHAKGWARVIFNRGAFVACLFIWLIIPPSLLYMYSCISDPIFGPSRYTLFVGPAYLLLVARGLSKLPWRFGFIVSAGGALLSGVTLLHDVYRSDRYTNWKSVAAYLNEHEPYTPLAIVTTGPFGNTELETARYYLGPERIVIPWVDPADHLMNHPGPFWVSISRQDGRLVRELPSVFTTGEIVQEVVDFPKLRLIKVNPQQAISVQQNNAGYPLRDQN